MGFFGSGHCIGMCGGIANALTFGLPPSKKKGLTFIAYQLFFSLGRILTYMAFGLIAGILGAQIGDALGHMNLLFFRILIALMIVLFGLYLIGFKSLFGPLEKIGYLIWRKILPIVKQVGPINNPIKAMLLGGFWGFLPCGLVYSAMSFSLLAQEPKVSALIMGAFGLGTLPTIICTPLMLQKLSGILNAKGTKVTLGTSFILFGIISLVMLNPVVSSGHCHHHTGL